MQCEQELCTYWTGAGCVCRLMDIEPQVERSEVDDE